MDGAWEGARFRQAPTPDQEGRGGGSTLPRPSRRSGPLMTGRRRGRGARVQPVPSWSGERRQRSAGQDITQRASALVVLTAWGRAAVLGVLLLLLPPALGDLDERPPAAIAVPAPGAGYDPASGVRLGSAVSGPLTWIERSIRSVDAAWWTEATRPRALPFLVLTVMAAVDGILAVLGGRLVQRFVQHPIREVGDAVHRVCAEARVEAPALREGHELHGLVRGLDAMADELGRTRATLRGHHRRGEEFLESAPVGIATVDGDLRVVMGNGVFRELTGSQGRDIVGEPLEYVLGSPVLYEAAAAVLEGHRSRYDLTVVMPASRRTLKVTITGLPSHPSSASGARLAVWGQEVAGRGWA